jgi:hypothetical protein
MLVMDGGFLREAKRDNLQRRLAHKRDKSFNKSLSVLINDDEN